MSLKLRWVIFFLVFAVQTLLAAHGYAQWRERERRPVKVAAAIVVTRETPNGAWLPVDLKTDAIQAGDRIQVNLRTDQPVYLHLIHLRGAEALAVRLHPAPGDAPVTVAGDIFYSLPSPTTWYSVDRVSAEDRLVLIASRAKDDVTEPIAPGRMSAEDLTRLRSRMEAGELTGGTVFLQVPLPDGRVVESNLIESMGTGSVWMEWNLGR